MMARSRQRVRLEDGLKLNINKLIGRGGIQPGSKTRAIAVCPQAYGEQSLSGVLTAEFIISSSRLDAFGVGLRGSLA